MLLLSSSCGLFTKRAGPRERIASEIRQERPLEVTHHLQFLGRDYLSSSQKKQLIKLSSTAQRFLQNMHERIVTNNELLFPTYKKPKFHFINDTIPFHFSLPGGDYFFSSGLIKKYLANEDLLAAVMSIEILRCEKLLYEGRTVVPAGNIETERMLSILRLPIEMRNEINKWTYLIMRRAGYDPGALLNLIQLKNKNALDFASSIGNISSISREEFNYKNFLSRTPGESPLEVVEKNSSRGFYALRSDVQGE